jgi:hypothetical protein
LWQQVATDRFHNTRSDILSNSSHRLPASAIGPFPEHPTVQLDRVPIPAGHRRGVTLSQAGLPIDPNLEMLPSTVTGSEGFQASSLAVSDGDHSGFPGCSVPHVQANESRLDAEGSIGTVVAVDLSRGNRKASACGGQVTFEGGESGRGEDGHQRTVGCAGVDHQTLAIVIADDVGNGARHRASRNRGIPGRRRSSAAAGCAGD